MVTAVLIALTIVAICVAIHTVALLIFAEWMFRRFSIDAGERGITHYAFLLLLVFGVVIVLHIVETSFWAGFYYWQNLFNDYETALYFSLISYTTIGFGDVVLPQRWRLLGAIEGISGVLLCGISTAFIFAIVNALFRMRMESGSQKRDGLAAPHP
jgi:hypothetical protein